MRRWSREVIPKEEIFECDPYSRQARETMVEDSEISNEEDAFMWGYEQESVADEEYKWDEGGTSNVT